MSSTSSTSRGLRPWQFFLTASFLGAAAAVWLSPVSSPVALLFMSLAIVAAGASASALHGVLIALAGRRTPESIVSTSVRQALDREKLHVLRSLKDLEFDKAMGKVSAADAAPLEQRLRERAMAIMQDLDSRQALRARIEADLAARQALGQRPETRGPEPAACTSCATVNDPDAKFCKGCGRKLS